MRRLLDAVLGAALLATSAQAAAPALHDYYVLYHHDARAYGKPVDSVWVHTGVLMENPESMGGDRFWVQVRHEPMERREGHFFSKEKFVARSRADGPRALGVAVQYWVHFADGTSHRSRDYPVTFERRVYGGMGRRYTEARGGAHHEWNRLEDTASTRGFEITADLGPR